MNAPISLSEARRLRSERRVGAWPSDRRARAALPPASALAPPATSGQRQTGQMMGLPPPGPGCVLGGNQKAASATVASIAAGGTATATFTFPGAFCVNRMFIDPVSGVQVSSIRVGTRETVLSGTIPSSLFSPTNECCPVFCFDCVCGPGVPLTIGFSNEFPNATGQFKVILFGTFTDACP